MVGRDISIVVPFNNEEKNIEMLYSQLKDALDSTGKDYELIFIDDGSNDNTYEKLSEIYNNDGRVNVIKLSRNFGQAVALAVGINFASGAIIITMDGDLQHDPADLGKFLEKIYLGYDMVNGWKRKTRDNIITKRIPSLIVKIFVRSLLHIRLHDISSTFRAYRSEVIKGIKLYGGLHRFIPLLIKKNDISICEIEIKCNRRKYGKTHYGLERIGSVLRDILLLSVKRGCVLRWHFRLSRLIEEARLH